MNGKTTKFDVKPKELLKRLIAKYSDINDIVVDFCMAKGSTGSASLLLQRRFVGIETEKLQFDWAARRLHEEYPFGLCPIHRMIPRPLNDTASSSPARDLPTRKAGDAMPVLSLPDFEDDDSESACSKTYRICPTCGKQICLTKANLFRKHSKPNGRPCPQSFQPSIGTQRDMS